MKKLEGVALAVGFGLLFCSLHMRLDEASHSFLVHLIGCFFMAFGVAGLAQKD